MNKLNDLVLFNIYDYLNISNLRLLNMTNKYYNISVSEYGYYQNMILVEPKIINGVLEFKIPIMCNIIGFKLFNTTILNCKLCHVDLDIDYNNIVNKFNQSNELNFWFIVDKIGHTFVNDTTLKIKTDKINYKEQLLVYYSKPNFRQSHLCYEQIIEYYDGVCGFNSVDLKYKGRIKEIFIICKTPKIEPCIDQIMFEINGNNLWSGPRNKDYFFYVTQYLANYGMADNIYFYSFGLNYRYDSGHINCDNFKIEFESLKNCQIKIIINAINHMIHL